LHGTGAVPTQTITLAPASWSFPTQKRLLMVDDEPSILLPAARYFRRLAFHVDRAETLESAMALVSGNQYDLAILDLRLSSSETAEGMDVLRGLRARTPAARVIVLSAYIEEQLEMELQKEEVDAILRKPQSLPSLAEMAIRLLGGTV